MERNINIQTATTRLRKTFQYPTDESSDPGNSPEAMDEEEQETLIATLAEQNHQRNQQFRQLLLLMPAISSIPYLLHLIPSSSPSSRASSLLLSLLSLSSLASTAFLVSRLPPTRTGIDFVDQWSGAASSSSSNITMMPGGVGMSRRRRSSVSAATAADMLGQTTSPLEIYLPYLNGAVCLLAVLTGYVPHLRRNGGDLFSLWLGTLPGLIYAVVLVAKVVMAGVDPERDLGGLKYEYKGA
ncbi:hypothetical protein B0H66DRAFT_328598 [Apodospora peruviana]|uniref:Uncharacterized protein n=1 Tax=Apodospora peruviana TaxID=516989 RepID=A0AAE0HY16_9PEZI|nr:hypothetical protein B0H66DRAFT_328598 [Apodospora peruviana]